MRAIEIAQFLFQHDYNNVLYENTILINKICSQPLPQNYCAGSAETGKYPSWQSE
jgi:hypothetical protein